jgi:hypothetical protein
VDRETLSRRGRLHPSGRPNSLEKFQGFRGEIKALAGAVIGPSAPAAYGGGRQWRPRARREDRGSRARRQRIMQVPPSRPWAWFAAGSARMLITNSVASEKIDAASLASCFACVSWHNPFL